MLQVYLQQNKKKAEAESKNCCSLLFLFFLFFLKKTVPLARLQDPVVRIGAIKT